MAVVNPPPNLRRPYALASIPGADEYLKQMEWIIFQLWQRTGGGDDIVTETANHQVDTDALFGLVSRVDDIAEDIEVDDTPQLIDLLQNVTATAVDYTSVGDEIVICTDIVTIALPAAPDDQQRVKVKRTNGDVVIDGNGKKIDGYTTITTNRNNTLLDMVYLVEQDAWYII